MEMKDRIGLIIEKKGLSNKVFSELTGIQTSNVTHLLSGRSKPNFDSLQKILAAFPDLNTDWLLLDKEPMFKFEKVQERTLFDNFSEPEQNIASISPQKPIIQSEFKSQEVENQSFITNTVVKEVVKEIPARKVTRIVIYYSDNSFEEFFH